MKKLFIIICTLTVSGCASLTRGVNEDVIIQYEPTDASVRTSLNHQCSASPCTVSVPRNKKFQVFASKPGYQSQTVNVGTKVAGKGAAGFAGNVLAGGVIGMGVDAATGAALDHDPNPVIIKLLPENVEPAQTIQPTIPQSPAIIPSTDQTPTT